MSRRFDCADPDERSTGLAEAVAAVRGGRLVVLPTDTVYGVGADAFTPRAVNALLSAKGRGRSMPVPVLIGSWRTLDGLVDTPTPLVSRLVEAFWPGALTLVLRHTGSLAWDLGESRGTVAVRMPLHPVALDLLAETGPLAVSSANRTGAAPATTVAEAEAQLGASIDVYLDGGPTDGSFGGPIDGSPGADVASSLPSTILDLTGAVPRVLRAGAVPVDRLREIVPALEVQA